MESNNKVKYKEIHIEKDGIMQIKRIPLNNNSNKKTGTREVGRKNEINPFQYYTIFWKRWNDFKGRSSRAEYWWAMLVNIMILGPLHCFSFEDIFYVFFLLYYIASLIPLITLTIRRLHDTGKSGWWILITFVPILGGLILFLDMISAGDTGGNQYGNKPD